MATRQEVHLAWDVIRCVNIVNDVLDDHKLILNGTKKRPQSLENSVVVPTRDYTVDELKASSSNVSSRMLGYINNIKKIVSDNQAQLVAGLASYNVSLQNITDDTDMLEVVLKKVDKDSGLSNDKDDLKVVADYIEDNVDELLLVRKVK